MNTDFNRNIAKKQQCHCYLWQITEEQFLIGKRENSGQIGVKINKKSSPLPLNDITLPQKYCQ